MEIRVWIYTISLIINVRVYKFSTHKSKFFVNAQTISIAIKFSYEYIIWF